MSNPRYDGKPLLRLIELWVLWVIGELKAADAARLTEMEPTLRDTWSLDGAWHEMIEEALQIAPDTREAIRAAWRGNLDAARQSGAPSPTGTFAETVADQIAGTAA